MITMPHSPFLMEALQQCMPLIRTQCLETPVGIEHPFAIGLRHRLEPVLAMPCTAALVGGHLRPTHEMLLDPGKTIRRQLRPSSRMRSHVLLAVRR